MAHVAEDPRPILRQITHGHTCSLVLLLRPLAQGQKVSRGTRGRRLGAPSPPHGGRRAAVCLAVCSPLSAQSRPRPRPRPQTDPDLEPLLQGLPKALQIRVFRLHHPERLRPAPVSFRCSRRPLDGRLRLSSFWGANACCQPLLRAPRRGLCLLVPSASEETITAFGGSLAGVFLRSKHLAPLVPSCPKSQKRLKVKPGPEDVSKSQAHCAQTPRHALALGTGEAQKLLLRRRHPPAWGRGFAERLSYTEQQHRAGRWGVTPGHRR